MRHSSQPFAAPFLCGHIAVLAASSALSPIIPFYLQQSLAELWRAGSNLTCSLLPPSSCSPSALHRVYSTNRLLLPKQKQRRWATQHNAGCVYQLKNEAISACMYKDHIFFFYWHVFIIIGCCATFTSTETTVQYLPNNAVTLIVLWDYTIWHHDTPVVYKPLLETKLSIFPVIQQT